MTRPCPRLWQAEAVEDGRLVGADRDSFERHAETCPRCGREREALAKLRRALAGAPTLSSTPLERRRLRSKILELADADVLSKPAPRGRRVAAFAALTMAALASATALWPRPTASPPPDTARAATPARAPVFELEASDDSQWHKEEEGETVRHRLVRGRLALHVAKLDPGQRFIVELPDGELEVKGTRFDVEVDGEGTRTVHCSEGQVALRIGGREVRLFAGDAWSRPLPPAGTGNARVPAATSPTAPASPSGGEDFVAAMAAFSDGDLGRAEKLLLAFERRHPGDARVEDAAYLRAVARARRGDREGARELAREYLRRYPNGLRGREAEKLAAAPR